MGFMKKQRNENVVVETEHHILDTDTQSLKEYEKMCKKLNIDLDYLIFEFI